MSAPEDPLAVRYLAKFTNAEDPTVLSMFELALKGSPQLARVIARAVDKGWLDPPISPRTRLEDRYSWAKFEKWAAELGLEVLPASAETVSLYAAHRSRQVGADALSSELHAIRRMHTAQGFDDPTSAVEVVETRRGLARSGESTAKKKAHPITLTELRTMVDEVEPYWRERWRRSSDGRLELQVGRWRALLLVGWAGALRPGELVTLERDWLRVENDSLRIRLPRSKMRPEGRVVTIVAAQDPAYCPLGALAAWLEQADSAGGADIPFVFPLVCRVGRHAVVDSIARYVNNPERRGHLPDDERRAAAVANLVSNEGSKFSRFGAQVGIPVAPSRQLSLYGLRRGPATEADRAHIDLERIRRHLGQIRPETTAGYVDPVETHNPLHSLQGGGGQ